MDLFKRIRNSDSDEKQKGAQVRVSVDGVACVNARELLRSPAGKHQLKILEAISKAKK